MQQNPEGSEQHANQIRHELQIRTKAQEIGRVRGRGSGQKRKNHRSTGCTQVNARSVQ